MKIKNILLILLALSVTIGCKKLEVENINNPDFAKVYSSGDDLKSIAGSLFNTFYEGSHSYSGVQMFLATAADNGTCSWGNQAMRDMSWEPRNAWNNAPNYSYEGTTKFFFDKMYASINTASNVLKAMDGGVKIGPNGADDKLVRAFAKYNQGIAYGNLALVFDKAFIVDENTSLPGATVADAKPYAVIGAAAVAYLDVAIGLATANTFTVPKDWLGTPADVSSAEFARICNTAAARILSYMPRTSTQLAAVNWAKVKTYADAGITSDFSVLNDQYVKWYQEAGDYLTYPGWARVDMYVVNMMDPANQPQHWTDSPTFPHPAASTTPSDQRLLSDFQYLSSNAFRPERGYYHYSNYRHSRYDAGYLNGDGLMPEVMKSENDMLKAEARAYTGDVAGAAAIINAGTRVTRGSMAPVAAVLADVVKAIHHERHVEMFITGVGLQFFEMRKRNLLQKGTLLHWPIPAKTLETFGEALPFYTFGGGTGDGTNSSNVGWR
jgi:hypothetical protein